MHSPSQAPIVYALSVLSPNFDFDIKLRQIILLYDLASHTPFRNNVYLPYSRQANNQKHGFVYVGGQQLQRRFLGGIYVPLSNHAGAATNTTYNAYEYDELVSQSIRPSVCLLVTPGTSVVPGYACSESVMNKNRENRIRVDT